MLWIGGEAGSGKTTLAAAAAGRLRAAGWRTVHGRCPEMHGAPAGWAWTEVLRELIECAERHEQKLDAVVGRERAQFLRTLKKIAAEMS